LCWPASGGDKSQPIELAFVSSWRHSQQWIVGKLDGVGAVQPSLGWKFAPHLTWTQTGELNTHSTLCRTSGQPLTSCLSVAGRLLARQ